jgi:hypothetical protein
VGFAYYGRDSCRSLRRLTSVAQSRILRRANAQREPPRLRHFFLSRRPIRWGHVLYSLFQRDSHVRMTFCVSKARRAGPFEIKNTEHVLIDLRCERGRSGGESGIRTHGPVARTPVFKTGAFNRSAISPREILHETAAVHLGIAYFGRAAYLQSQRRMRRAPKYVPPLERSHGGYGKNFASAHWSFCTTAHWRSSEVAVCNSP